MWVRDEYMPSLDDLTWLSTPEGQAVCAEMAGSTPADTPTAISRWRERLDPHRVTAAWSQVLLRVAARDKFSRADSMLFDRIGLEQSTDETVAAYKARRFSGCRRIADLGCGIGGDCLALAEHAPVVAVDISGPRAFMAEHNSRVYGRKVESMIADVELTQPTADAAHIDPDRRLPGRRRHEPEHGSPDLVVIQSVVRRYRNVGVKFSPGAALQKMGFEAEIELISHNGNCKQAVAWTGRLQSAHRRATVLPAGATISAVSETQLAWPQPGPLEAGGWLIEPDPAIIRADLVGLLARHLGCRPIDPRIAWLVGDEPPVTPFGRLFRILDVTPFREKKLRGWLAGHDIGPLEIKTRGVALDPDRLARRLQPSGSRDGTLLVTRVAEKPIAILAERRRSPHD